VEKAGIFTIRGPPSNMQFRNPANAAAFTGTGAHEREMGDWRADSQFCRSAEEVNCCKNYADAMRILN
jgi:hypothetical protein